jgi:hypothetical protein
MLPYFNLSVQPGQSVRATALITNLGTKAERIKLSRSTGVTAVNGGITFAGAYQRCYGPGCWVSGLPGLITLPVHSQQGLRFAVHIPRGTPRGQYLAGITAELASKPHRVTVGSSHKASAQAIIVEQVTVGIAVTVGPVSALTSRLVIHGVTGSMEGEVPRLSILVANTGQTFTRGQGTVSWRTAAGPQSARAYVGTVLPGGHALIAVNAPKMPAGATTTIHVRIRYGKGLIAQWQGAVSIPARPHLRIVHTGNGQYSVVPVAGTPLWAVALIIVGLLAVCAFAFLAWLVLRGRRRRIPAHAKPRDLADRLDTYSRK